MTRNIVAGKNDAPLNLRDAALSPDAVLEDHDEEDRKNMAAILSAVQAGPSMTLTLALRDEHDVEEWVGFIQAHRGVNRTTALRAFRYEFQPMLSRFYTDFFIGMVEFFASPDGRQFECVSWVFSTEHPTFKAFHELKSMVENLRSDESSFRRYPEPPWFEREILNRLRATASGTPYEMTIAKFADNWEARRFDEASTLEFGPSSPLSILTVQRKPPAKVTEAARATDTNSGARVIPAAVAESLTAGDSAGVDG